MGITEKTVFKRYNQAPRRVEKNEGSKKVGGGPKTV